VSFSLGGSQQCDAHVTFTRLLDPRLLPPDFAEAIGRISYDSASLKINVALSELPNFQGLPGLQPAPHHRGTIHICPDQDTIERAYDDAKYGKPSSSRSSNARFPRSSTRPSHRLGNT